MASPALAARVTLTPMRTIVITGASDGIGAAASRQLVARGHRVVLVGRSPKKTRAVAAELGTPYHLADFSDLAQVRRVAGEGVTAAALKRAGVAVFNETELVAAQRLLAALEGNA